MAKKVVVNKDACIGCGLCTGVAPEIFTIGDDGKSEVVVEELPEELEAAAEDSAAQCPVQAIVVE
jgi:ferredoxin